MTANVSVVDHLATKEDTPLTIKTTSLSLLGSHPGDFKLTSVSNAKHGNVSLRNGKVVFNLDGDSVKAQLFDASGRKVGNEFLVNTETYAPFRDHGTELRVRSLGALGG